MTDRRPHNTASMLGEVLGNYRVTEALDSGGMGSVYKAEHTHLGRPAAIKLLRPELTTNDEIVQRFFNEAKAATAIRHPGIVEVYDFGYTEDGRAYYVMELLDGDQLGKRLAATGGRMSELEAARIAKSLANVLRAAHAKGIVHRDLKPDNIFLVPDPDGEGERVKVLDFGVAKLVDVLPAEVRHTQTGALMGTPLYMAPEQARAASAIDHRADQYSLGCILYELLAGKPPFVAEGAGEIIALQMFAAPQPLRERLADVSPEMEGIVAKLLEKEPRDRYASAAEVAAALGAVTATLSNRLSAERPDANANQPRFTQMDRARSTQLTVPMRGQIGDERPELAPAKRSAMPIIAAVATVVLAGGGAIFAVLQSSDDAPPSPGPAPVVEATPSGSSAPAVQPPDLPPVTATDAQPAIAPVPAVTPGKTTDTAHKKPPRTKTATPAGTPVTRPDVGPDPKEIRTPITDRPVETKLEDDKSEKPASPNPAPEAPAPP